MSSFFEGFEKAAASKDDPSWLDKQIGMFRAKSSDPENGSILASNELLGKRLKRGVGGSAITGGIGAGVGAGLAHHFGGKKGKAALLGAGLGALPGYIAGVNSADNSYLKERGINQRLGGLTADFSEEAKKKYIR